MPEPTPFEGLNAVLAHLTEKVGEILGENLTGLYLQGSFAVGDADEMSDCDFMAVIARDLTTDERTALEAMHVAIHDLPYEPWRHRLEGSYAPVAIIRRLTDEPRDPPVEPRGPGWADGGLGGAAARYYPFVYLDHGAKALIRSEHDNSQVVRWSLREKGVVLAGPDPKSLIDPVTPEMLRAEVRATMDLALALGLEPMSLKAWQSFWVGLYCRMLHTLVTGQVWSKKASATWARSHLEPEWGPLIARAQAIKEGDRAVAMEPADPAEVAATRAFVRHVIERADHEMHARELIARRLAEKHRGGRANYGDGPVRSTGPGRSGFTPPTIRPGGRGRRG
ncbi:MAG TPA: aminoglycoside adenylyltransferase domain-containing protein [Caulobacteraceae bacterium]|jgi:predicted nucleotidyltransferase